MPMKETKVRKTVNGNVEITILGTTAVMSQDEAMQFADDILVHVAESQKAEGYSRKKLEPEERE